MEGATNPITLHSTVYKMSVSSFNICTTAHSIWLVYLIFSIVPNIIVKNSQVVSILFFKLSTFHHIYIVQGDIKKRELLKNPTKIEEIQDNKFIDRNWTITTCLLRDSNAF